MIRRLISALSLHRAKKEREVIPADAGKKLSEVAAATRSAFGLATLDLMKSTGRDSPELRRVLGR